MIDNHSELNSACSGVSESKNSSNLLAAGVLVRCAGTEQYFALKEQAYTRRQELVFWGYNEQEIEIINLYEIIK